MEEIISLTENDILQFIEGNDFVNFSAIAKHFKISKYGVPFVLRPLITKKKISIKKIGGNKFVLVNKGAE